MAILAPAHMPKSFWNILLHLSSDFDGKMMLCDDAGSFIRVERPIFAFETALF